MARVFRAARIARLVAEGCYDPKLHDEVFSRFGWQSCDEKELLHVPCVLVMESSGKIKADGSVGQLCRLLRSGRPIHVLIDQDVSDLDHQKLDGSLEDLAAVAMTCREAFVCQSTLARPDHLLSCFDEMAKSVRPSVAFVSSYPKYQASQWAWESLLVSHYSRMAPCFYDSPESGHQKTMHLDLTGNPGFRKSTVPDPDSPSPATAVDEIDAVTAAHAAALWPEFRQHFRIIPKQAWSNELQSIEDYLDEFELAPPSSLPYIRIEFHGQPGRAIITREMANVCRDRYLAWKRLQQLAGTDFGGHHEEHEVRTDLPLERAGESDVVRKKWQQEGAAIAVNRLVQALLDDNQSG
jgi:pyruvate-ferredoxin/flavodoxin oxidoreductase